MKDKSIRICQALPKIKCRS